MATTAQELREQLGQHRETIDQDLDELRDRMDPRQMARRRASRIRGRVGSARDAVMGTADDVRSAASDATEATKHIPQDVTRRTAGNPLGAGLVAFGLGLVAAAVWPASEREQELARRAEGRLREEAKQSGSEVIADLREPASQSAGQLKQQVKESAEAVTPGA